MSADRLLEVALRLTDGDPVDWESAESAVGLSELAVLSHLRDLESLARLHRTTAPVQAGVHDSIRSARPEDSGSPLKWGALAILEKIGTGAYGDVYRARDPRLGRDVALKLLRHRDHQPPAELVHEGSLLARVRHPNVVTVFGAERIDGRTGVWMELLQGESLEQELRRRGPLPVDDLLKTADDLCGAVRAVHAAGLLHRDIKAQNVVRTDDGRLVLMDFGTGTEADVDGVRALAGTPVYLAPEVLDGAPPTQASDVYALGVLLFRAATGTFPVSGLDIDSLRRSHRAGQRQSAASLRPDLPAAVARAIDRATDSNPGLRFSTVELQQALTPRQSSWLTARRIAIGALGATLLASSIAGAVLMMNRRRDDSPSTVTLSRVNPLLQWPKYYIRSPGWEPPWVSCTPSVVGAVALCNVSDGTVRAIRTPQSGRERSSSAVVSPDGRRVAYLWFDDSQRDSIRIADVDGTNDRELLAVQRGEAVSLNGWSRNSEALLLSTWSDEAGGTELLRLDDSSRRKLRCEPERLALGSADLSPDGRFLVFEKRSRSTGSPDDVWLLDIATSAEVPISTDPAIDRRPLWTPEGRAIAMASNRLGTWGVFRVPVVNGVAGLPELVRDVGRSAPTLLGFTRTGTLFLTMLTSLEDVVRAGFDGSQHMVGAAGRADSTALDESNRSPDWSPDGTRFAFISGAWRGDARIVVARADGSVERQLSFPGLPSVFGRVRWSPDAHMLAATANNPGGHLPNTIDVITLDSGARRTVVATDPVTDLRWARDGAGLYYLSNSVVHVVDVRSGIASEVYRAERPWRIEPFATFDLSRDGESFLLAVRSQGVKCAARIVTRAGSVRDLPPFPSDCRAIAWTHDERAVLASVHGAWGEIPLWMVPIDGGEPVRLPPDGIEVTDISVRPDGRELLLGTGNPRPDFWTLSGFTPGVTARQQR